MRQSTKSLDALHARIETLIAENQLLRDLAERQLVCACGKAPTWSIRLEAGRNFITFELCSCGADFVSDEDDDAEGRVGSWDGNVLAGVRTAVGGVGSRILPCGHVPDVYRDHMAICSRCEPQEED